MTDEQKAFLVFLIIPALVVAYSIGRAILRFAWAKRHGILRGLVSLIGAVIGFVVLYFVSTLSEQTLVFIIVLLLAGFWLRWETRGA